METFKTKVRSTTIQCERYADLYEFNDTLLKRKLNAAFIDKYSDLRYASSMQSTTSKHSHVFEKYGTLNFEEADTYLTEGWEEGIRQLAAAKLRPTAGQRVEYKTDFVGHRPCVGNVVRGLPKTMIRTIRQPQPVNEVELVYYNCCGFSESETDIAETARKFLDAAYAIEQQGTRVGITILAGNEYSDHEYLTTIRVKKPGQPFNLSKLSYPLCHPAFFRRHIFRWIETAPFITNKRLSSNYGHVIFHDSQNDFRQAMIDAGVIGKNDIFVTYYWMNCQEDGDAVVKEMARQNASILAK